MAKYRKRLFTGQNVFESAKERIRYLYKRFDRICVSFSGGKDSTAVLQMTIMVARELGKLPVHTIFVDEEAIPTETVDYVRRVSRQPEVKLDWYCLPVKHRNACSLEQPYWYCWNPNERHKWVRELPPEGITQHPAFEIGMAYQEWLPRMFPQDSGTVGMLSGIRSEESLRRLRLVMTKKNDCFVQAKADFGNVFRAFPIYDWRSGDVWKLIDEFGFDYNKTYDVLNKTRIYNRLLSQRVCQPFGEEPLRSLWLYSECWPEMWSKLLERVPGVATAWRYANTDLYLINNKPESMSWEAYTWLLVEQYQSVEGRKKVRHKVNSVIRMHQEKSPNPIPDAESHPYTGVSWKFLAKLAGTGDFKRRKVDNVVDNANKVQKRLGITAEQAKEIYGWGNR